MTRLARLITGIETRLDGSPLIVMLDVDGTLAPIVPRPEDARVPEDTRAVLAALASLSGVTVALVSGRAVDDTMRIARVPRAWVVGNHGFEVRSPDGRFSVRDEVVPYEGVVADAARSLDTIAREVEGAIVENKRWTLSIHYRLVDPAAVPALLAHAKEIARSTGLRVTEGKKIMELRSPVPIDKGTATLALAEEMGALTGDASAMFAGDDLTDEDAFRALRSRKPDAVTARILENADDSGRATTDAEFVLESPEVLRKLLEWLAARRRGLDGIQGAAPSGVSLTS